MVGSTYCSLGPLWDRRVVEIFVGGACARALQAFGVDPGATDQERHVRVLAALTPRPC